MAALWAKAAFRPFQWLESSLRRASVRGEGGAGGGGARRTNAALL
jgi:hypothetical protein